MKAAELIVRCLENERIAGFNFEQYELTDVVGILRTCATHSRVEHVSHLSDG